MNNLEKVKRHLAKEIPCTIKNDGVEDVFCFKPLNIEQQAILMELGKVFNKRGKIKVQGKEVLDLTKEDIKEVSELLLDVVMNSMSDLEESVAKDFVSNNFDQLSKILFTKLIPENRKLEDVKKTLGVKDESK